MTNSRSLQVLGVVALIAVVTGIGAGIFLLGKKNEERQLYSEFTAFLTPEANARYRELSLFERLATAHHVLPTIRELRLTDWTISAKDLTPVSEEDGVFELIYTLGVGDSELQDCIVSEPFSDPAGSCQSFVHTVPAGLSDGSKDEKLPVRSQSVSLDLHLGEKPYASSNGKARLKLGADSSFLVEGQVVLDSQDVRVTDAAVLIPNPLRPESEFDPVRIVDFSPRRALEIQSIEHYKLNATYDMPAAFAPFFEEEETKLTVLHAEAAVRMDLLRAGYHLEGTLIILNHTVGEGVVEYYPGQYASIYVQNLSIPAAIPSVCFNIRSALLELDFSEERLRLAGTSEINTVDSFLCERAGVVGDMGFVTRVALGFSLDAARSWLELPEVLVTNGHLVVDLDDSILCADMAVNGHSLFHAAYLGNDQVFRMWAPRGFVTEGVSADRFAGSIVDVFTDSWNADWTFPESSPLQCWDGDKGPRTDMRLSLLSGGSQSAPVAASGL